MGIPPSSLLFGIDRPFAESGDIYVIAFYKFGFDNVKNVLHDTDAILLGHVKFFVNGLDHVNLCQTHDGFSFASINDLSTEFCRLWKYSYGKDDDMSE